MADILDGAKVGHGRELGVARQVGQGLLDLGRELSEAHVGNGLGAGGNAVDGGGGSFSSGLNSRNLGVYVLLLAVNLTWLGLSVR